MVKPDVLSFYSFFPSESFPLSLSLCYPVVLYCSMYKKIQMWILNPLKQSARYRIASTIKASIHSYELLASV